MEFDSEDCAKRFYNDYARRVGFMVSGMQRRRCGSDGRNLAHCIRCSKHSFSPHSTKAEIGPERKLQLSEHEGCWAMIMFKLEKSGKCVVTRFYKDHNHPLVVTFPEDKNLHEKKKRIQGLAHELQRQEDVSAAYRESFVNLLSNVETQADNLSSKVLAVVQSVRKAETEALIFSRS